MEEQASNNSITICLPPNLSLSDINAENLRNVVEAAYQSAQDAFNQNGEIVLYVKEQDQGGGDHQLTFEAVGGEGMIETQQPGMVMDPSIVSLEDSSAVLMQQLQQESDMLNTQEGMIIPVSDTDQYAAELQIDFEGEGENGPKSLNERTMIISGMAPLQQLTTPQKKEPYRPPGIVKQAIKQFQDKNIADAKTIEKVLNEKTPKNGPPTFDIEKLKKEKLTTPQGSKIFCCKNCDYRAATRTLLKQHELIHKEKTLKCKECDYSCHTLSHLKRHMFTHSQIKPILCTQCSYTCTQMFQMRSHMLSHDNETPFVCNICNASYKKEDSLKVHMLGHQNVTKFRCTECNYAGNRFGDFKRHMLTHTAEKPLKCSVCSYTCIRLWRLKAHMKVHDSNKPLLHCDVCDYTCVSTTRLKDHKLSHWKDGIIRCDICEFVCTQPSRMRRHMKSHINATTKVYSGTSYPPGFKSSNVSTNNVESMVTTSMAGAGASNMLSQSSASYLPQSTVSFPQTNFSSRINASRNTIQQPSTSMNIGLHDMDEDDMESNSPLNNIINSANQYQVTATVPAHNSNDWKDGIIKCDICEFVCTQPSRMQRHMKSHINATTKIYTGGAYPPKSSNASTSNVGSTATTSMAGASASNMRSQELNTAIPNTAADAMENTSALNNIINSANQYQVTATVPTTSEEVQNYVSFQQDLNDTGWTLPDAIVEDQFNPFAGLAGKSSGETYTITTPDGGQTYIIQTDDPDQLVQQLSEAQLEEIGDIGETDIPTDLQPDFHELVHVKQEGVQVKEETLENRVPKVPLNHSKTKRFHCEKCDFSCDFKSTMTSHQKKHSSVKRYKCAHCKYMCNDTSRMKDHLLCHTTEKVFKCEICGFACKRKMGLKDHMKIHTGEKPFKCKECDYTCRSSEGLKSHMAKHYGYKPFTCEICGAGCSSCYLLKKHKMTHGEKPLKCSYCDYSCIQKKQLTNHLLQHKFQHPFCCNLCSATYKKEESLKIHMMSHQNIKKFVCNMCNYAGNRAADFRRHMLTHSTSKPLQCPQCSYSCIRQSRLKAHMLIHTQERTSNKRAHPSTLTKAYRCAFCDFACARTSRLKAHLSKVHLDLPNNVIFSIDLKQVEQVEQVEQIDHIDQIVGL